MLLSQTFSLPVPSLPLSVTIFLYYSLPVGGIYSEILHPSGVQMEAGKRSFLLLHPQGVVEGKDVSTTHSSIPGMKPRVFDDVWEDVKEALT